MCFYLALLFLFIDWVAAPPDVYQANRRSINTDLSQAPATLFYVSTLMKHAASGANAAFMLVPDEQQAKLRPLWTGWLADASVLAPLSCGLSLADKSPLTLVPPSSMSSFAHGVSSRQPASHLSLCTCLYVYRALDRRMCLVYSFECGNSLAGGTPAVIPSLLVFNLTMQTWQARALPFPRVSSRACSRYAIKHLGWQRQLAACVSASMFVCENRWSECVQEQANLVTVSTVHSYVMALQQR